MTKNVSEIIDDIATPLRHAIDEYGDERYAAGFAAGKIDGYADGVAGRPPPAPAPPLPPRLCHVARCLRDATPHTTLCEKHMPAPIINPESVTP